MLLMLLFLHHLTSSSPLTCAPGDEVTRSPRSTYPLGTRQCPGKEAVQRVEGGLAGALCYFRREGARWGRPEAPSCSAEDGWLAGSSTEQFGVSSPQPALRSQPLDSLREASTAAPSLGLSWASKCAPRTEEEQAGGLPSESVLRFRPVACRLPSSGDTAPLCTLPPPRMMKGTH